jgi:outer membrane protein assembly factor BamB
VPLLESLLDAADAVAAAEGGPCSLPSWSESSQGLCRDIQALQQDPFSSKLYAVAGSGSLPGGVYRSRGTGQKWKRLFGYRCGARARACCRHRVAAGVAVDEVFVVADHKNHGRVAALEPATGKVLWEKERPPTPNYSSPVVWKLFGREQLILTGCDKVAALDPATGETIWEKEGATTECVTTTVTDGQRVYSSGGYPRNHIAAYRADGTGTVDWENGERVYVPSLLYSRGHLYCILDAGIAACFDAATGEEKWKQRLGGNFSASPVMIGDTILATDESGQTHVFRATPEKFEAIAVNRLGDETFASPAVCSGRIYFRVAVTSGERRQEKLVCIGKR